MCAISELEFFVLLLLLARSDDDISLVAGCDDSAIFLDHINTIFNYLIFKNKTI